MGALPSLQEGGYTVLLAERVQVRRDNPDSRREVLRGTWSFAKSDGSFQPYAEGVAAELEHVFAHVLQRRHECADADEPDIGLSVDVGGERRVLYIGKGSWVQQRGEADVGRVGKHLQVLLRSAKTSGADGEIMACLHTVKSRYPALREHAETVALVPVPASAARAHRIMDAAQDFSEGSDGVALGGMVAELMSAGATCHAGTVAEAMLPTAALERALIRRKATQHAISGSQHWSASAPPHHRLMPLYGRARCVVSCRERERESECERARERESCIRKQVSHAGYSCMRHADIFHSKDTSVRWPPFDGGIRAHRV